MTVDEAIEMYANNAEYERTHGSLQGCMDFRQLAEWLKDYKRLKEQEPCDAISRQAALDLCERFDGCVPYSVLSGYDMLPPVTVKPKTGKWIYKSMKGNFCSECDEQSVWNFNYCPNCGAKMVEPQERSEE